MILIYTPPWESATQSEPQTQIFYFPPQSATESDEWGHLFAYGNV